MNKFKELMGRKFLGLKGLYWLLILVVAFGVYAFLSKDEVEPVVEDVPVTDEVSDTDAAGLAGTGANAAFVSPYAALASGGGGTVVVQNSGSGAEGSTLANDSIRDNIEWTRRGVAFLTAKGIKATSAQTALSLYLTGGALSTTQEGWVNQVMSELGVPPYADEVTRVGDNVPTPVVTAPRSLVRYVKKAGHSYVFAQYSDNTVHLMAYEALRELQKQKRFTEADIIPASDPIWTYPTYNLGGKPFDYAGTNEDRVTQYGGK